MLLPLQDALCTRHYLAGSLRIDYRHVGDAYSLGRSVGLWEKKVIQEAIHVVQRLCFLVLGKTNLVIFESWFLT